MGCARPIEDFIQYINSEGTVFIAIPPQDSDLEPWFNEMVDCYGLEQLTQIFPYVTLVLDEDTGILKPWKECSYNAKVTNAFHILLQKKKDEESQCYGLENLEKCFPIVDEKPQMINPPTDKDIIMSDKDGYRFDYTKLPEYIIIEPLKNWHPNKDAYGNYMSPYHQYYNNYTTPYPGGFNNYSYLPNLRTFDVYPF